MYNGILVFDKPADFTSHDVVAKLRGILRQKKIGHAGTLDPMATGVLVILLGNATRASDYAAARSKEYVAGLKLGATTDTQDITGKVLSQVEHNITAEKLKEALSEFEGTVAQIPPMYSAITVGGTRLYKLARQGVEIERQSRDIEIEKIELLGESDGDYSIRVACSKGTYIRTLCHDIGESLGCGACMSSLRRTAIGGFKIEDALDFDRVKELHDTGRLEEVLLPTDSAFENMSEVRLNRKGMARAVNGAFISADGIESGEIPASDTLCRVYDTEDNFIMLGRGGELDRGGAALFCHKTFFIRD